MDKDWLKNTKKICFFYDNEEFNYFIAHLLSMGFIGLVAETLQSKMIKLLPKAFDYLENVNKTQESNIGFCAMWFDDRVLPVYEEAMHPAIYNAGYSPFKVNNKEYNDSVIDEIISNIRRSKFLVADLTSVKKAGARGGVYFEAGFAKGLGLEVIFTCEEKYLNNTHFDVKGNNILQWRHNKYEDFKIRLQNRIESTLGRGRGSN
jgi:nucleoside 2-deoxyribosyltransferase